MSDERKPRRAFHFVADVQADTREAAAKALRQAADAVERGVLCGGGLGFGYDYSIERKPADVGVTTRHPRCGYPYCACVGECFVASQPGGAAGVSALPTPKLCPGCAQYHGRNDCPVGWLAPAVQQEAQKVLNAAIRELSADPGATAKEKDRG